MHMNRRGLLSAAALLPLAACVTGPRGYSIDEAVSRLLTLSSERAFGRLLQPNGFYDNQLARIAPPDAVSQSPGGMSGVLGAFMRSDAVRRRVAIALNDVAVTAARRASPVILDAIHELPPAEAERALRGGPHAATDLLQQRIGDRVVEVMLPEVAGLLQSDLLAAASAAFAEKSGIDYLELGRTVATQAAGGIFRVMGQEEAAIRADPRATRDPALIALLAPGRR